jgi:hypothetical protein
MSSVRSHTLTAVSGTASALADPVQHRLERARIDAVGCHQGHGDGVGQEFLARRFMTTAARCTLMPSEPVAAVMRTDK